MRRWRTVTVDTSASTSLTLGRLRPVDLDTVLAHAELLERVDRKYVVPLSLGRDLVGSLVESHQVLSVAGRTTTTYRTTYFDTAELQCVRDHIQGRRLRFKARSRLYVEDDLCRLEVKTKNRRGATVKSQLDIPAEAYGSLTDEHRQFIDKRLDRAGVPRPDRLEASLELDCCRATLIDLDQGVRVTFDTHLTSHRAGHGIALDPDYVIVETKSSSRGGKADLLLRRAGFRPRSFSKYAAMGSLLEPSISDNAVRTMLGVQLHRQGVI